MGARDVLSTISNWMAGLRRAVMMNSLKSSALFAAAGFVAVTLAILLIETFGHLSGNARAVLLTLWTLSAVAAFGLGIIWPLLRYTVFKPSDKKLAGDYAERLPKVRDRVLNALQLLERAETADKEGYSPDLVLEAGRGVAEDLIPINPRELPDTSRVKTGFRYAAIAGAVAVLLFVVAGRSLLSAAERVMNPDQDYAKPALFSLSVTPGDAELVRGDSLLVEISATGDVPQKIILERQETGKTASEPVSLPVENGKAKYVYRGVTTTFSYWAHADHVKTEQYKVNVTELPAVRFLSVRLAPPAYTGLEETTLEENVGAISAVRGTTAHLSIAATKPLSEARIDFLDVNEKYLAQQELKLDGTRASGDFTINESGHYRIHLKDTDGRESRDGILYRITARPDEDPVIALKEPARDIDIAANVKVPVVAEAADDFGFTKMNLRYYRTSPFEMTQDIEESKYETISMNYDNREQGKAVGEMLFDLTPLELLPEDQVMIFAEVWDNDRLTGPKRARSDVRILRFPSMAEIFHEEEQQSQEQRITLGELMQASEEMREKVEEAIEEYKSNPEMNWERKQEIEQLMEQQRQMNDVLNQVAQAIDKAQQQAEIRSMFSPETMEKMQQIQELVQEVITPEMREAMQRLAEAMQQPSEEEMRKALENFKMNQEMFQQALDQTLNMLKQMQAEKKLDELARRLDELSKQQEKLNEAMDKNTPENAQKNADEQKKLSEEMKAIEKEMKELAEQMKQNQTKGQEQAQQIQKQMEQEKLSEEMQQNSESMNMCQNQSAKKKGGQMKRQMQEMAQQMQNLRQQMQTDQMQEALEKLEEARDQMLDLSQRQEQLWQEAEQMEANSPQMADVAEEQENLRQALNRIQEDMQELARTSMMVPPKLMSSIFEAQQKMQAACNSSQERDGRTASHYRKQAMSALNNALKEQNSACSQCKSQCNKPNSNSSCNNAGQMAQQQKNLRQQSMGMCNNPGSLTPGEQASMQRLAGEQNALAKSAEQLAQEAAASKQSLGRLEDVVQDMKDVAKDMENMNVTQRTIEKQEHIESRLLDYQRANREREFSPKRRANTGTDIVRSSPTELPDKPGTDQLREDLLRALDTKYTPDYEEHIRQYFEALSKTK